MIYVVEVQEPLHIVDQWQTQVVHHHVSGRLRSPVQLGKRGVFGQALLHIVDACWTYSMWTWIQDHHWEIT